MEEEVSRTRVLKYDEAIVSEDIGAANQFHRILGSILDVGGGSQNGCARAVKEVKIVIVMGIAQRVCPKQADYLFPWRRDGVVAVIAAIIMHVLCGQGRSRGLGDE